MATIFEHPDWVRLLEFLYIRRGNSRGVNGARHRIECRHEAGLMVFGIRTSCAACGREIQNVREDARHAWTFNASCPLAVNYRCARMPATTEVCAKVRAAIEAREAAGGTGGAGQGMLWD
jgi:hypothetical protein